MPIKPAGKDWRFWTPPNVITSIRIVFFWLPGFLLLYLSGWWGFWAAFLSFGFLSLTDLIDGWVARYKNGRWRTKLGSVLDATADKLSITSYVIALCVFHLQHIYILAALLILIAREIWLSLTQWYHLTLYRHTVETNPTGRTKTVFLCLAGLALSVPYTGKWWYQALIWVLLAGTYYYTAVSSKGYIDSFSRIRRCGLTCWENQPTYSRQLLAGGWKTVPNLLTLSRAVMSSWAMILLIVAPDNVYVRWAAAVVFTVAACTDFFDGWVARHRESVSKLGKWLDPITDKVFIGFTFVGLTIINHALLIPTVIILLRELVVVVMQNDIEKHGEERISSSWTGKTKMTFQCIAAGLFCLPPYHVVPILAVVALVLAIGLTIASGFEYLVAYVGIRKCRAVRAR